MGLKLDDLQKLAYKDVAKIMLCFVEKKEVNSARKATQSDWDRLARRK